MELVPTGRERAVTDTEPSNASVTYEAGTGFDKWCL